MMSEAEHLDFYFDKAFDKIQFDDVVTLLQKHIEIMDISIDHKNSVLSQLEDWCNDNKHEANIVVYNRKIIFFEEQI